MRKSKPFYFNIRIPKHHDKAIIILQRLGLYGIHGEFKRHLTTFFKEINQDLVLELSPLVSKELAEVFINEGNIKELSLRRYDFPSDLAGKIGLSNHIEDILCIEFKIVSKPKRYLPYNNKIKKFINNSNSKLFDIPEFTKLGFNDANKTTIKVKHNGNYRTIDLEDTGQIRPYYDIDREVTKDPNGHPHFESIDDIANNLLSDLYNEFYS